MGRKITTAGLSRRHVVRRRYINCEVDILTDDVGFSARLSGTEDVVHALSRSDYMAERVTSL